MIEDKVALIQTILKGFTGLKGEPGNERESYVLKSLWVMMMSEFEAHLRDAAEEYIDYIKTKPLSEINICILVNNFYGDSEENLSLSKVLGLYKRKREDINYSNFTRNKKQRYKSFSVENLFNTLGIFFSIEELDKIKLLDGMASTRDSIAHGDQEISITASELLKNLELVVQILDFLLAKFETSKMMAAG